ncbi:peptidase [Streptomyces sp. ISL-10]|uniref:Clp protease N-terminal domain-containing protein n=1 Tax=Streptomyces sp. ISL-10 TaxID=2819172 RepID=UPI001BE9ABEA|nr:Clp protease N-terminal domain-containing protein [Streptomyces sp. ISL-10]MBT2365975.1 peptidase [Streptomyces sp. ISL-10]
MFERFTRDARAVVTGAVACAERADAPTVTDEHLLLSLLDLPGGRAEFALRTLGVLDRRDALESSLAEARRRGGMTRADEAALAGIGIDVDRIVASAEEAHGAGVLAYGTPGRRRKRSGHRPFTAGAKGVLEKSLRIALGRRDRTIGAEHLLLALAARPGVVAEALADHGATYASVERVMYGLPNRGSPQAG